LDVTTAPGRAGFRVSDRAVAGATRIASAGAGLTEQHLRRALAITDGEPGILVESPMSEKLWIGVAATVIVPPADAPHGAPQARRRCGPTRYTGMRRAQTASPARSCWYSARRCPLNGCA